MPYQGGNRLPAERASKLGHLEVLGSDLVNQLIDAFEQETEVPTEVTTDWDPIDNEETDPCDIIFGIDGSLQVIPSDRRPRKELAFVKTALLRLDNYRLQQVDPETPHPFVLRDILAESAVYHSTVFPLRNIRMNGMTIYHTIRQIIHDSLNDESLEGEPYETLKWIMYEKWNPDPRTLPSFECPNCRVVAVQLPFNADGGQCSNCNFDVLFTDVLGFHIELGEDFAPNTVATTYMLIHETLLLFTGIRYFWEENQSLLSDVLFVKDGPLYIRAHYSKLVNPIRRFLQHASEQGISVNIVGQEKSGVFYDFLDDISDEIPPGTYLIPDDEFIKHEIQQRPTGGDPYGFTSNYGAKVLIKLNHYHHALLNIPTGDFKPNPTRDDLIGFDKIMSTLPTILSNKFEGALLPVELANGIASLSTYPSARILRLFAEDRGVL